MVCHSLDVLAHGGNEDVSRDFSNGLLSTKREERHSLPKSDAEKETTLFFCFLFFSFLNRIVCSKTRAYFEAKSRR